MYGIGITKQSVHILHKTLFKMKDVCMSLLLYVLNVFV